MDPIESIFNETTKELSGKLSEDQIKEISPIIRGAIVKGLLEGQHRAVDTCKDVGGEEEQDLAHKIATTIRKKNDALIANLSSMR